jgi:hypothetical protein
MILDGALVAPCHEDEMLDAGCPRLVDHVLDHRPIDHRQHLLGNGLGGGQETSAKTCHWEDRLADALVRVRHSRHLGFDRPALAKVDTTWRMHRPEQGTQDLCRADCDTEVKKGVTSLRPVRTPKNGQNPGV